MKPGYRYLGSLVRAYVSGRSDAPTRPASLSWNEMLGLLSEHHLVCAVAPLLLTSGLESPERLQLEGVRREQRLRSSILLMELSRVVDALEHSGYRPIVLKGGALAQTVYRRAEERYFGDLDVLVHPDQAEAAIARLLELGYRLAQTLRHHEFYRQHHFHRILVNPAGVVVELHWNLSRPGDYFRFDVDSLARDSHVISTDGCSSMRILSDTDQLLHTAEQSIRDGFTDLRRMVDAAWLLERGAADDPTLERRAAEQGMGHGLWLLLRMTRETTGIETAQALERRTAPGGFRQRCLLALDLPEKMYELYSRRRTSLPHLVRWLCAPDGQRALVELRDFVFPTRRGLLDRGHDPAQLPSPARRMAISLRRALSAVKLAAYQCWNLVMHL